MMNVTDQANKDPRLLSSLLDSLPQAILAWENEKVVFANRNMTEHLAQLGLFGKPPINPCNLANVTVELQPLTEKDSSTHQLQLYTTGQDTPIAVTLTGYPGNAMGRVNTFVLASSLQNTQQDNWANQLLAASPVGLVVINQTGTIILANPTMESLFGYPENGLFGVSIDQLLPERYRDHHSQLRQLFHHTPSARLMGEGRELFALRADGSEFPVEIGLNPVQTPSGDGVLATIIDISRRKGAEHSFLQLIQNAPYGVIVVSKAEEGKILFSNAVIGQSFGYPADELTGKSIECLLPSRFHESHPQLRAGYSKAPKIHRMGMGRDLMACHKNGSEFPVEIGLSPIFWQGQQCIMAAITDISARKQSEQSLKQANANLEEFTYVASHDLRSPLHGLAELTEWMQEDISNQDYDKLSHNLDRIKIRVQRMERIISDLLAYARASNNKTEEELVDPRQLVDNILELAPLPPAFTLHTHCSIAPFMAAKTPIETVLRNLISNAVKHHDRENGQVDITIEADDRFCRFAIRDDGPGIPQASLERIFMLFQTLSATQRNHSGIGLAVSKRLVESHGGRIEAITGITEGRGAEFRFWWPRFTQRNTQEKN